jgi:hypothetical protein
MSSQRFQHAIDVGRGARTAATKVRNSLFPVWRQRAFRHHLGRFIVSLQAVPQEEAAQLTPADIREITSVVDGVVAEAEAFMSERHNATIKEVEQDRFVVTEIYELRSIVETLARRFTADPDSEDAGWQDRTKLAHRTKH